MYGWMANDELGQDRVKIIVINWKRERVVLQIHSKQATP